MKATLIIGNTGRGKSTSARALLNKAKNEKREILIYDPNAEYREFYSGEFLKPSEFLNLCLKKNNAFILIEEATIFFSNNGRSEELTNLLVRKRHMNNEIVILFHSLRAIPVYIMELINFVVIYKTADRPDLIYKKFEGLDEIIQTFEKLKNTPDDSIINFHKNFVIELNKPVHLTLSKLKNSQKK